MPVLPLSACANMQMFGEDNPFMKEHIMDYEESVKRKAEDLLKKSLTDLDKHRTRSDSVLSP